MIRPSSCLLRSRIWWTSQVEKGPMWQLLFWISLAEVLLFPTVIDMDKKDREPGDFALDPLNLCKVRKIVQSSWRTRKPPDPCYSRSSSTQ